MKKCLILILISAGLLLCCWMAFSTSIIADARNKDIYIAEYDEYTASPQGLAFFELGDVGETTASRRFEVLDDIYDTVSGAGWAYNVSPDVVEETTSTIILQSNNKVYIITPSVVRIKWLSNYLIDVDPTPQWYSGFWFEFCPLGFDHGDYKVLIELKRDDGSIALVVNTGYHLVRSAGQTVIEYRPSEKTAELNDIMAGANSGIQEIRKDADGNLIVTGWGMIEGVDADDTSCILVVEDDNGYLGTFTTLPYAITYINNYYGSDLYYNSGFMASIPNFTGEELRLRVYVQHGDDTYGCNYRFESDGDIANIIMIQE